MNTATDKVALFHQFGTESQCLDYLFHLRWENGYLCPKCQHNEMWEIRSHKYKCKKCGYQTTVIAGTLFQDTHIPMTTWFHAAWYYSTFAPNVTVAGLKNELRLSSHRTAYNIYRKLSIAFSLPRSIPCKLAGTVEVALTSVRFHQQKLMLVIAVEVTDHKAGHIRLEEFFPNPDYPGRPIINSFIESVVEPGSKIRYLDYVSEARLKNHGYIGEKESKRRTHPLLFAKNACYDALNELDTSNPIREQLAAYCVKVNNPTSPISFEELLTNAIHMAPRPYLPGSYS